MISFTKMHGLGNDYIYIELLNDKNIIVKDDIPKLVRYLCNRHFGVGADGVIFIDSSNVAAFKMIIYNPDGSKAQMCGNGIRCFAKYVYDSKLISEKSFYIETDAGIKKVDLKVEKNKVIEVSVCMGKPVFEFSQLKRLGFLGNSINSKEIVINSSKKNFKVFPVSIGNPHAVIFVNEISSFNVKKYGKLIENSHYFPEKVNVEFVQLIDKGHIKIRVWERGVGETLACGTGACAAVASCIKNGFTRDSVSVYLKGGVLLIKLNKQNNNIYMAGIATKVFDGKIFF